MNYYAAGYGAEKNKNGRRKEDGENQNDDASVEMDGDEMTRIL